MSTRDRWEGSGILIFAASQEDSTRSLMDKDEDSEWTSPKGCSKCGPRALKSSRTSLESSEQKKDPSLETSEYLK